MVKHQQIEMKALQFAKKIRFVQHCAVNFLKQFGFQKITRYLSSTIFQLDTVPVPHIRHVVVFQSIAQL
jgi:hypothetical protein